MAIRVISKDIRGAVRVCKQYLAGEIPEGPFLPFHKSFSDFLLENKKNLDYHIDAVSMHRRIAEYYWSKYGKNWSNCDDYGLANLAVHLYKAEQFDRLAELISQEWMHARVAREGYRYDGFVADLTLAWQRAYENALGQIAADDREFSAFDTCFRGALIRTSINSLSSNYPPALVKRALETGVWSFARALDVAAYVPNLDQRAEMYLALLEVDKDGMTERQREEARRAGLTAARAIEGNEDRAQALAALAPQLSGEAKTEALAAARAIEDKESRVRVLLAFSLDPDDKLRVREIRRCLVGYLEKLLSHGNSTRVLTSLLSKDFDYDEERLSVGSGRGVTVVQTFSPGMGAVRVPILSGETAASLARHVTEICRCWRWL